MKDLLLTLYKVIANERKKCSHLFAECRYNVFNRVFARSLYVVLDPTDNSVTLSPRLCKYINPFKLDDAKVLMFRTIEDGAPRLYAFTLNPKLEQKTQLADLQYNTKHKTIGFETLVPTVNRIYFDYKVPDHTNPFRFPVRIRRTPQGFTIYQILNKCKAC